MSGSSPRQHDGTAIVRLAGQRLRSRRPKPRSNSVIAVEPHRGRVHDHGRELRIFVDVQAEQQHRSLCGDQHPMVVGQLEAVGGFPSGVVEEGGDQRFHSCEFCRVEHAPVFEVAFENRMPVRIEAWRVIAEPASETSEHQTVSPRRARRVQPAGSPRHRRSTRRGGARRRTRTGSRRPRRHRSRWRCRHRGRRGRSSSDVA